MKTVTDKYIEMNHNFIQLRDSIVQKVDDEVPMSSKLLNDVLNSLGVLTMFLDEYKRCNKVKTVTKKIENEIDETPRIMNTKTNSNVIVADPKVWESVMKKGSE